MEFSLVLPGFGSMVILYLLSFGLMASPFFSQLNIVQPGLDVAIVRQSKFTVLCSSVVILAKGRVIAGLTTTPTIMLTALLWQEENIGKSSFTKVAKMVCVQ